MPLVKQRADLGVGCYEVTLWMTVKQTAEHLNFTEHTVRRYIWEGKLDAKKERGLWFVDIDSIERFKEGTIYEKKGKE